MRAFLNDDGTQPVSMDRFINFVMTGVHNTILAKFKIALIILILLLKYFSLILPHQV